MFTMDTHLEEVGYLLPVQAMVTIHLGINQFYQDQDEAIIKIAVFFFLIRESCTN